MRVMGINPYHDSSVAVYSEEGIELFFKEERLTGHKRDSYPYTSIKTCMMYLKGPIDKCVIASPTNKKRTEITDTFLKKLICPTVIDISDQHHLQHASLAFYNSGFEESLVVVIDREGSFIYDSDGNEAREAESVFVASYPHTFKPIIKNYWSNSNFKSDINNYETNIYDITNITKVYESATILIGQHPLENGKTMGLSSYGDKKVVNKLFPNKNYFKDLKHSFSDNIKVSTNLELKDSIVNDCNDITDIHKNYAFQVQQETQEQVLSLIKKAIAKTGIKKVCVTGGYGLNVVCNGFLSKELKDVDFYFEPIADDTGNSIGSAMLLYRQATNDKKIKKLKNTFFHGVKSDLTELTDGIDITVEEIVDYIIDQKSVAVFNGLAEAGPRALGNRSILFDARNKNAKDLVNKIKNREWYRPFAAIVLEEDAHLYFDLGNVKKNEYMTQSFDVVVDTIPGVTHVDNTCRIQTVNKNNKSLYKLLKLFKEKTGCSVLLNTSFNLAGMPLVETPTHAKQTLLNSTLDYVWFPEVNKIWVK